MLLSTETRVVEENEMENVVGAKDIKEMTTYFNIVPRVTNVSYYYYYYNRYYYEKKYYPHNQKFSFSANLKFPIMENISKLGVVSIRTKKNENNGKPNNNINNLYSIYK